MSYSFVDDEEEVSAPQETTYSFVDTEEKPKKEEKSLLRKAGEAALSFATQPPHMLGLDNETVQKAGKAVVRGVGTTVANLAKESKQVSPHSLPYALGFGNEERPEPEIATKLRENLPEAGTSFGEKTLERVSKHAADPRSLIFGAPGAVISAISGVSGQVAESAGAPEWLQNVAEVGVPIALTLGKAAYQNAKPGIPSAMTQQGGKLAKAEVLTTPKAVNSRLNKIGEEAFKKYEQQTARMAEPFNKEGFDSRAVATDLNNITIGKNLDSVSPPVGTQKQFGELLQNSLENIETQAKEAYTPRYAYAIDAAKGIETTSESTIKYIDAIIEDMESLETKPANYQKVINDLKDISKDLGKEVKGPGKPLLDMHGEPIEQAPKVVYKKIPLSKKIELNNRIAELVDYDIPEYSIKDRIKPVKAKNKQSIRDDLRKKSPEAADAYEEADQIYGETAERFKRKSVQKIMKMEANEKINAIIDSPTTLEDLKAILPQQDFSVVERQVLEKINGMSHEKAVSTFKEVKPYLSENAQNAGDNILRYKDPKMMEGNWNKHANAILDEIQDSFTKGTRPENTLKLMQTKKGYKTVYQTLHNSPTGQKALKMLQKQYIDDMVKTTMKSDGSLDFKALSELMNANETNQIIVRQALGAKGLKEANQLANYAKNIRTNFELYAPKSMKDMGLKDAASVAVKQGALPLVSYALGGLPLLATGAAANQGVIFSTYLARRILASPKAQAAVRELAHPKTWADGRAEAVAQVILKEASKED